MSLGHLSSGQRKSSPSVSVTHLFQRSLPLKFCLKWVSSGIVVFSFRLLKALLGDTLVVE